MRKTITKLNAEIFIGSKKNKKLVEYDKNKYLYIYICILRIYYNIFHKRRKTKVALKISRNLPYLR